MDHAHVILRAANIAGVFKGDPRVSRLKKHREHSLPNLDRGNFVPPNLTLFCFFLVRLVLLLKFFPV